MVEFDKGTFIDFVMAHGYGEPNPQGLELGEFLVRTGDDYATAAAEVVARGFTEDTDE